MVSSLIADEAAREALINRADLYFWWLIGSTAILLVGAFVEYFNPFEWLRKSNANFAGKVRASRRWSRSIKISERLAVAMVIVGIGGEGVFEYLAARAEDDVREYDSRVSIAARDRADKAEQKTAILQSVVMPLDLTDKQQSDIGAASKRYAGRIVRVNSNSADIEGRILAPLIVDALKRGGLKATLDSSTLKFDGLDPGVTVTGPDHAFIESLRDDFERVGGLNASAVTTAGPVTKADALVAVGTFPFKKQVDSSSPKTLLSSLQSRVLTRQQQGAVCAKLKPFSGQKYMYLAYTSNEEVAQFTESLFPALDCAGWKSVDPTVLLALDIKGLIIDTNPMRPDRVERAAVALIASLPADIRTSRHASDDDVSVGTTPDTIRIVIGRKP